ncbi:hypothetical protein MMYC01_205888 [Madurella mycetomatis]|uniref:Uncharacterized protein n=1 Tax=Madurella mycetomatis TaxID=100816 RepID=A0A175W497_9PEZI|nr:hypothetical protein MMYC01_205888 [Madurella mycetomatis]
MLFLVQDGHLRPGNARDFLASDDEYFNQTWEELKPRLCTKPPRSSYPDTQCGKASFGNQLASLLS